MKHTFEVRNIEVTREGSTFDVTADFYVDGEKYKEINTSVVTPFADFPTPTVEIEKRLRERAKVLRAKWIIEEEKEFEL